MAGRTKSNTAAGIGQSSAAIAQLSSRTQRLSMGMSTWWSFRCGRTRSGRPSCLTVSGFKLIELMHHASHPCWRVAAADTIAAAATAAAVRYPVQCPVGSSTFRYGYQGGNPYYKKMMVANTRMPVRNVQIWQGGAWTQLTKTIDNYWVSKIQCGKGFERQASSMFWGM